MDLIYRGDLAQLENFSSEFLALGGLEVSKYSEIDYPDLYKLNGIDETSIFCKKGYYRHAFGSYLRQHNPEALRAVYNIFSNVTAKYPDVGETSVFVIEGYPLQAAVAIPEEATAKPYRDYPILLYVSRSHR